MYTVKKQAMLNGNDLDLEQLGRTNDKDEALKIARGDISKMNACRPKECKYKAVFDDSYGMGGSFNVFYGNQLVYIYSISAL